MAPAQNLLSMSPPKSNYQSPNSKNNSQLFSQVEELIKFFTDHLGNLTKSLILEEDNSFIQESLSKKFLEPVATKEYHFNLVPQDFLHRVDIIKADFDN